MTTNSAAAVGRGIARAWYQGNGSSPPLLDAQMPPQQAPPEEDHTALRAEAFSHCSREPRSRAPRCL